VAVPDEVLATMNAHRAAIAFRPQGVAAIVVVEPTTPLPSEPTREASVKVTRQTKGEIASQALIVLGDGFWASAIRGLMTTFAAFGSSNFPRTVTRTEMEGVRWTLENMDPSDKAYEPHLLAALAELKPPSTPTAPPKK
ncbi:MAG: hypothetical protein ABW133_06240, partial [Polyangiaceae bacterium]